jgi:hypothetical protein
VWIIEVNYEEMSLISNFLSPSFHRYSISIRLPDFFSQAQISLHVLFFSQITSHYENSKIVAWLLPAATKVLPASVAATPATVANPVSIGSYN